MSLDQDRELAVAQERFHRSLLRRYVEAQRQLDPLRLTAFEGRGECAALFDAAGLETRVFGFDATDDALALLDWLTARGEGSPDGIRVELGTRADAASIAWLSDRSCPELAPCAVFTRSLGDEFDAHAEVDLEWANPATLPSVLDVIGRGFGDGEPPSPKQRVAARAYGELGEHLCARVDGVPAAGAALFVEGTVAYLSAMAVLPRYRGLHLQTALITARLRRARALGCTRAFVTSAPEGTSRRNLERAGFRWIRDRRSFRWLP